MAGHRPPSLKVRALQWLAQREYSRSELRQRLLRLVASHEPQEVDDQGRSEGSVESSLSSGEHALGGDSAAEVEQVLDWLEARRYLSDARFAESRVQVRSARFGNLRIQGELRQHGVALSHEQQQALRDSEFTRAQEVWRRKFGALQAADAATRVKQMRFLAGRGFSAEVVRRVVRGGMDD